MSNDWLLRQYEDAARALASLVFGRDFSIHELPEETSNLSHGDMMLYQLRVMVREGRVGEAEDLLFETVEASPLPEFLLAALGFYEQLQMMNDAQLAACNFTREEIFEGMAHLRAVYERAGNSPPGEISEGR